MEKTTVSGSAQSHEIRNNAERVYRELCAACHGVQATGGIGPDLTASRFRYGKTRDAITISILDGRSGGMPAFGSHLKAEQATELANYLLSL